MSIFGEIVEPATRTAWEDWDEGISNNFSLSWKLNTELPKEIGTLILLEGKYLTDFVQKRTSLEFEVMDSIPDVNLSLVKIKGSNNNYVCLIKDYDLVKSSEVIVLMKDHIVNSKNVISVQSKPLSEYQVISQYVDNCVIRTITTTKSAEQAQYPKLEQPNIISGISAGAISLREHLEMTALAYICYIECTEDYDIKELQKLLEILGIKQTMKPLSNLNTNLYV